MILEFGRIRGFREQKNTSPITYSGEKTECIQMVEGEIGPPTFWPVLAIRLMTRYSF